MQRIRKKCGYENSIDVGAEGSKGGLTLGWKGNLKVELKSFSRSHIDAKIQEEDGAVEWRFTSFHGSLIGQKRQESSSQLRGLHEDGTLPWLVMGDLNEIMFSFDEED